MAIHLTRTRMEVDMIQLAVTHELGEVCACVVLQNPRKERKGKFVKTKQIRFI